METLSSFWAYTLNCSCTKCASGQQVTIAKWLPHLPRDITVEGLLATLDCGSCGSNGSFDVSAAISPALAGGRADNADDAQPVRQPLRA